jgi:hypothetical protein
VTCACGGASSIVRCVIVEVEGSREGVSVETLTQKSTRMHDTAKLAGGETHAHMRGAGLDWELGAELSASSVDQRSDLCLWWRVEYLSVRHRRGGRKQGGSECRDANAKSTRMHDTAKLVGALGGETHAHKCGAGLSFARAQTSLFCK